MRRLECRQRTNSDVWIHQVACKFPGFFNKPPTLYRYWEPIIYFKLQKQGSLSSFRPLTGWGLHRFLWKSQREYIKGRPIECYHFCLLPFLTLNLSIYGSRWEQRRLNQRRLLETTSNPFSTRLSFDSLHGGYISAYFFFFFFNKFVYKTNNIFFK